jgi:hypothetical protein
VTAMFSNKFTSVTVIHESLRTGMTISHQLRLFLLLSMATVYTSLTVLYCKHKNSSSVKWADNFTLSELKTTIKGVKFFFKSSEEFLITWYTTISINPYHAEKSHITLIWNLKNKIVRGAFKQNSENQLNCMMIQNCPFETNG